MLTLIYQLKNIPIFILMFTNVKQYKKNHYFVVSFQRRCSYTTSEVTTL